MDNPNEIPNDANTRAPFDLWLFQRRISLGAACAGMGLTYEVVRRNMLPVADPYFREASIATRKAVRKYTGGAIDLTDWPEAPDTQSPKAAPAPRLAEPAPGSSGAG